MHRPLNPPELRGWTMSDGYTLRGRFWPAAQLPAAGVIVYLHGIQSHGGWFERSASILASGRWHVALPDRRGSGLNADGRGDCPRAERWLADVDEVAEQMRVATGAPGLALAGVSWGGKLAVAWGLTRCRPTPLLLIAPGLCPAVDVGWFTRVRVALCLVACPSRRFPIPLSDPALFTDNPAGRKFIAADALKLTHATARFLYHSYRLDRMIATGRANAVMGPVSIGIAKRERIIRNDPTVRSAVRLCIQPPDCHVFEDSAHTIEFEPDGSEFERWLRRWVSSISSVR